MKYTFHSEWDERTEKSSDNEIADELLHSFNAAKRQKFMGFVENIWLRW